MRKPLPLVILLFTSFCANAQLAIIKDPDGFCNVRADASNQSKIEDTLSNGRFVYALPDQAKGNWLLLDYHKGKDHREGYIHQSRVVFLENLIAFKKTTANDSLQKLELNGIQITIKTGSFVKAARKIVYEKPADQYPFVVAIDGKRPWGTDGRIPATEYRSIQLKSGANTLTFPKVSFNDLFEVFPRHTFAYLDKTTGKIYIEAENSDGAGAYVVAWVINKDKIEYREEFIPF